VEDLLDDVVRRLLTRCGGVSSSLLHLVDLVSDKAVRAWIPPSWANACRESTVLSWRRSTGCSWSWIRSSIRRTVAQTDRRFRASSRQLVDASRRCRPV